MQEDSKVYELSYLILPSIAEDRLGDVVTKLKTMVLGAKGVIFAEESPIKIDLAYTMTKTVGASRYVVDEAYIGWMKFDAEPAGIEDLKDKLNATDEVIRFLLIKAPRETTFTFADARKELEGEENGSDEAPQEVTEPVVE